MFFEVQKKRLAAAATTGMDNTAGSPARLPRSLEKRMG